MMKLKAIVQRTLPPPLRITLVLDHPEHCDLMDELVANGQSYGLTVVITADKVLPWALAVDYTFMRNTEINDATYRHFVLPYTRAILQNIMTVCSAKHKRFLMIDNSFNGDPKLYYITNPNDLMQQQLDKTTRL